MSLRGHPGKGTLLQMGNIGKAEVGNGGVEIGSRYHYISEAALLQDICSESPAQWRCSLKAPADHLSILLWKAGAG